MSPILAATRLSPRAAIAQSRAALLARDADVPLHLLHVLSPFSGDREERSARARLNLGARRLRQRFGVRVEWSAARGPVASTISRTARSLDARLIVMGAGRRGAARRLWRLSRAYSVQRRAGLPVLEVHGAGEAPYQRVLIASELSSDEAAVLNLIRPLRFWFVDDAVLEKLRRRAHARAAAALARFAAAHGVANASLETRRADVPAALRLHARESGADLLVLAPEKSWLKAALDAGVTRQLLANPPCDALLAVRPALRAHVGREVRQRLAAP
jgi:nucleotide-binding universal stress UspA family protein